jgi:hypothetical protein
MMESLFVEFLLFFIANPVLVIWARIDATKVPDDSMFKAGEQLIWVIVFVFTGFIGPTVYLAVGRPSPGEGVAGPSSFVDPNQPPPPPPGVIGWGHPVAGADDSPTV